MRWIKTFEKFRFLKEEFEDNFPESIKIYTENGSFELVKSDFTREIDVIRCSYWHNTAIDGRVWHDGEPDLLMFDIHFHRNEKGLKTLIDITYGDKMVSEFSIQAPNEIQVILYNGFNSKLDRETQFGFEDETLKDICNLINKFSEEYKVKVEDLTFIDKYPDSYVLPEPSVPDSGGRFFKPDVISALNPRTQKSGEYPLSQGAKILIINNSTPPENRYLNNLLRYFQANGINHIIASNIQELKVILKDNIISSVISTGSEKRVDDDGANEMTHYILKRLKCPFLGICFGFQSLAKWAGSKIATGDFTHDNINLEELKFNSLFKDFDLTNQQFSVSFNDYPEDCPENYSVICKIEGKIGGIANEIEKNWGVLFHPEDIQSTWSILDNFVALCDSEGQEQKALKRGNFNKLIK
jgi:GMP synthase-like glutamine amidotransferase